MNRANNVSCSLAPNHDDTVCILSFCFLLFRLHCAVAEREKCPLLSLRKTEQNCGRDFERDGNFPSYYCLCFC